MEIVFTVNGLEQKAFICDLKQNILKSNLLKWAQQNRSNTSQMLYKAKVKDYLQTICSFLLM